MGANKLSFNNKDFKNFESQVEALKKAKLRWQLSRGKKQ